MKVSTSQKQWMWFVGLWCAGFVSISVLAYCIKWTMGLT